MEFIKLGKRYLIKNSNGRIVDEKTKLELENKELVLKDITGCECQKETTKKISKNKKRIKEIDNEYEELLKKKKIELFNKDLEKITALQDKENADGTIEETISTD
jgi:hypothetical protein